MVLFAGRNNKIMTSKLDLLEKRLGAKVSPVTTQLKEFPPAQVPATLSLFVAVDQVHGLANELWKDVQIFGPHQATNDSSVDVSFMVSKKSSAEFTSKKGCRSKETKSPLNENQRNKLDQLVGVYCKALDNNVCLSVLDELQLWLQLLSEDYDSSFSSFAPKDNIFSTIASRIYFVSKTFENQMVSVLAHVDIQICQLMYKHFHHRIPNTLKKDLEQLIRTQENSALKVDVVLAASATANSKQHKDKRVTFQQETDGRSNFLNQADFHAFCKQRDLFYNIKDAWVRKNNPVSSNEFSNPSTNCDSTHQVAMAFQASYNHHSKKLPHKVAGQQTNTDTSVLKMKQLMLLNSSSTNISRLAALFLSQFLLECGNFKDLGGFAVVDESLRQIFKLNPSKFKQLENRFPGTKKVSNDPLEFFKYFINLASWADFNQHLIDRCILELLAVDASVEVQNPHSTKELIEDFNKCRLLAKMLGYLYFHPYYQSQSSGNKCNAIDYEIHIEKQVQLRQYQTPPINLTDVIYSSVTSKKLTFTLPWVVEFLSQADAVAYCLQSYQNVLTLIIRIYRTILCVSSEQPFQLKTLSKSNQAFLRFYCATLFQRQNFPVHLIFQPDFLDQSDARLGNLLSECDFSGIQDYGENPHLDASNVVGDSLKSILFERQISEMKKVLTVNRFKTSSGNSVNVLAVKHVRPVTLAVSNMKVGRIDTVSDSEKEKKQIQNELQSCFFQNNPPSVKRTVDFISERISSNCLRYLRIELYPGCRDEFVLSEIFGEQAMKSFQTKALQALKNVYLRNSSLMVELMLKESVSVGALQACKEIVSQKCRKAVCDWITTHVSKDLFPAVESPTKTSCNRSLNDSFLSPASTKNDSSRGLLTQIPSTFPSLIKLQQILQKIYKLNLKPDDIKSELLPVLKPEFLGDNPQIVSATLDLALALLAFFPQEFSSQVEDGFVQYWLVSWKKPIKVLCPRNVLLFDQSDVPDLTWENLSSLVCKLVKLNVVTLGDIEEQCFAFLRHDWPPRILTKVSEFSKIISGNCACKSAESEVIDWISWACSEGMEL